MPHIHEKIDYCVEVFIVHKNKILLRMHDKYKIWLSVGGHIELDEDPIEAAIREVKEEVGLEVKIMGEAIPMSESANKYRSIIPPKYMGRHRVSETHEHIVFVYFATSETDKIQVSQNTHENAEARWVNKDEIEKMDIVSSVKFYSLEALKELGEK